MHSKLTHTHSVKYENMCVVRKLWVYLDLSTLQTTASVNRTHSSEVNRARLLLRTATRMNCKQKIISTLQKAAQH